MHDGQDLKHPLVVALAHHFLKEVGKMDSNRMRASFDKHEIDGNKGLNLSECLKIDDW